MKHLLTILLISMGISAYAQEKKTGNSAFSFTLGFYNNIISTAEGVNDLDFLNYANIGAEEMITLGYGIDFGTTLFLDIKLKMTSDLAPDKYNISFYKLCSDIWGMGVGTSLNRFYISYYEQYHANLLPGFELMDDNQLQMTVYDWNFYLSPIARVIRSRNFQMNIKFELGVTTSQKKEETFIHKKMQANEMIAYNYVTNRSPHAFINPIIEFRFKAFQISRYHLGFVLNTNWHYSKRRMNYSRTIQHWTPDNMNTESIKAPSHTFSRPQVDGGLYISW